jgi:AraC-like DNA-binding protein
MDLIKPSNKEVDYFSLFECKFGRIEIVKYRQNLVMHAHSQLHFNFWLGGGSAHSHVGNQCFNYSENVALGINSLASHDLCLDHKKEPAIFLVLYIENIFLEKYINYLGLTEGLPGLQIYINQTIRQCCRNLMNILITPFIIDTPYLFEEVKKLIVSSINQTYLYPLTESLIPNRKVIDHRLRKAMNHMRNNLYAPTVVDEVAEIIGLSRSRLFELFHDQLYTSPNIFWNSLRSEEAVKLLILDKENMTSVALALGFSTPGNFSRFFRDRIGVSPSSFQRSSHAC